MKILLFSFVNFNHLWFSFLYGPVYRFVSHHLFLHHWLRLGALKNWKFTIICCQVHLVVVKTTLRNRFLHDFFDTLMQGWKCIFKCLDTFLYEFFLLFIRLCQLSLQPSLILLLNIQVFLLLLGQLFLAIQSALRDWVNDLGLFFVLITETEAENDLSSSLLSMDYAVVLCQNDVVFKDKHLALFEFTDVVILAVVLSKLILVAIDFVLWQVCVLFTSLNLSS
jgi:hypothetical protein